MKNRRIAITGIGPIASVGIGREEIYKNLLNSCTGLVNKEFSLDGEVLFKYFLHEMKEFDINNLNINCESLKQIKTWKETCKKRKYATS